MECLNCEEIKLDENYGCKKCKLNYVITAKIECSITMKIECAIFVIKTIVKYVLDT